MRKLIFFTVLSCFMLFSTESVEAQDNKYLKLDETLNYKIKYGWLKIGDAELFVDHRFHIIDDQQHYLVQFKLKTVGWLRIFANVDLRFESYVNATTFQPHHASRIVMTGKKSDIQLDEFTYTDSIYAETYKQEKQETSVNVYPKVGVAFTDALSAYMYVRSKELNLTNDEEARLYIANHLYEFTMTPDQLFNKKGQKSYELIFPPIKEFPREKKNYVTLEKDTNIPVEIRLSTNNGNFFFALSK
ncbi:MAG: hypothetical protein ACI815_002909 [Psychroserpens sp.]|jgi:hypothetical protein